MQQSQSPRFPAQAREAGDARRFGFTLVELLVVIGIIALLIAILLPSLAAARRAGQRTACAAKLHSIMQAAQMHRNEHADYYPLAGILPGVQPPDLDDDYARKYDYFSPTQTSGASALLPRQLCPITTSLETEMLGSKALYSANGILAVPGETQRVALMLDPRGLTSFFICPAQASSPLDVQPQFVSLYLWGNSASAGYMDEPQSYVFNEFVLGWNDSLGYLRGRGSLLHQPALTMFAADGLGGSMSGNRPISPMPQPMFTVYSTTMQGPVSLAGAFNGINAGDAQNFDPKRHAGKINIAFCDGHVETRSITAGDMSNIFISPP